MLPSYLGLRMEAKISPKIWLILKIIHGVTWQNRVVLRNSSTEPNDMLFLNRLIQLCQLSISKTALVITAMKSRFHKKREVSWLVKLLLVWQKSTRLHKLANQQNTIDYVFLFLFCLYRMYNWRKIHVNRNSDIS